MTEVQELQIRVKLLEQKLFATTELLLRYISEDNPGLTEEIERVYATIGESSLIDGNPLGLDAAEALVLLSQKITLSLAAARARTAL